MFCVPFFFMNFITKIMRYYYHLLSIFTNNYNHCHYHNLSIIMIIIDNSPILPIFTIHQLLLCWAFWMFLAIHSSALSDGSDDLDQVELYFDDGFHQHVSKVGAAHLRVGILTKQPSDLGSINVINPYKSIVSHGKIQ